MVASKRTRDLTRTRAEILNATFFEVFQNGFQGTSVDTILARTKLTKGALFHQFPTKMDLGYALIDEVIVPMIEERWITPLEKYENPVEGILAQLKKNIGRASEKDLALGCPLNNLVQEMSTVDAGFKDRTQRALMTWINGVKRHIERAQRSGFIAKRLSATEIAEYVVMSHEGFYGIIKGIGSKKIFKSLYNSMELYFKASA